MDAKLFENSLRRHVPVSDGEMEVILGNMSRKAFRKGQFLIHSDAVVQKTFFIESGSVIAYFIGPDAEEHLIQFGFKGWWISDIQSFLYGNPAMLNIKAIEDTVVYEFTAGQIEQVYNEVPAFRKYFLIITQNAFASFQKRILNNLSLSAEQRYLDFCEKYPDINQQLSQKWIASYLGFTPEFLSRLKKQLLNK